MEVIIGTRQGNAPHVVAVLKRFALWGMVTFYDMDVVFQGVVEWKHKLLAVWFDETMNWPAFVEFLRGLSTLQDDPLLDIHEITFYFPEHSSLLDFPSFELKVRQHGRPA